MKKWMSDYFNFSRKDRIGLLVVLGIIVLSALIPAALPPRHFPLFSEDTAFAIEEVHENVMRDAFKPAYPENEVSSEVSLFPFDPNTISIENLIALGLTAKTAGTIENFRKKGGRFYKPEDLSRIYGLRKTDYERLLPYVSIEEAKKTNTFSDSNQVYKKTFALIDINLADSAALEHLPGIGAKLSSRIVNFRNKIGGFHTKEQLREVYGIHDTVFAKFSTRIMIGENQVKKININLATADEIKSHPYFKWTLANAIVNYRKQHGDFKSIEELKSIAAMSDSIFFKIRYYITVN